MADVSVEIKKDKGMGDAPHNQSPLQAKSCEELIDELEEEIGKKYPDKTDAASDLLMQLRDLIKTDSEESGYIDDMENTKKDSMSELMNS